MHAPLHLPIKLLNHWSNLQVYAGARAGLTGESDNRTEMHACINLPLDEKGDLRVTDRIEKDICPVYGSYEEEPRHDTDDHLGQRTH